MKKIITVAATLATMAGLYACSSHTEDGHTHNVPTDEAGGHTSPYPSCNAITQACHKFDVGEGAIHDCHDLAHAATSDEPCAAKKVGCLAICVEEAGADGGDAGESHDGH
jgi:hypothetical protein